MVSIFSYIIIIQIKVSIQYNFIYQYDEFLEEV